MCTRLVYHTTLAIRVSPSCQRQGLSTHMEIEMAPGGAAVEGKKKKKNKTDLDNQET